MFLLICRVLAPLYHIYIQQMLLFKVQLTLINTYIHTLMVVAAMQGANIRSSLGFSILSKDTLTCRPGESYKMLALHLSHSRPSCTLTATCPYSCVPTFQWSTCNKNIEIWCLLINNLSITIYCHTNMLSHPFAIIVQHTFIYTKLKVL